VGDWEQCYEMYRSNETEGICEFHFEILSTLQEKPFVGLNESVAKPEVLVTLLMQNFLHAC